MARVNRVIWCVAIVSFCVGCTSNTGELTRSKALRILQGSKEVATPTAAIPVSQDGFKLAQQEGWWQKIDWRTGEITAEPARQYFIRYYYLGATAEVRNPLTRKVLNITGVSDIPLGKGMKEVDFEWQFSDVPAYVDKYAGLSQKFAGAAAFKLYDDGWRVEEVQWSRN